MDERSPVFTEITECQDCYKCLRNCPAKAIRVENGRAAVIPERCVACGTCVAVCPNSAKHVREDLPRAKALLRSGRKVFAALAPSWVSEFPNVSPAKMIAALKSLGFYGVSETALGAQMVSARIAGEVETLPGNLFISSACPAAGAYIAKYLPEIAPYITEVVSPALAHCQLLRKEYGEDIGIVFFSPCVAKKTEADAFPQEMDVALTFADLHLWFDLSRIAPERLKADSSCVFLPQQAADGQLYPLEGGMLHTLRARGMTGVRCLTVSGLENIERALKGLDPLDLKGMVFVEVLACNGGCVNGPCMSAERPALLNMLASRDAQEITGELPRTGQGVDIAGVIPTPLVADFPHGEEELREALARVGKRRPEDELNCGGCGYDCCRAFAAALLEGRAEPDMCLSFLRKQAQKKANALLRSMPAGVVVTGQDLHVIECNHAFAAIVGDEALHLWEANPGLEGANLRKLLPFAQMLAQTLEDGQERQQDGMKAFGKLLDLRIFTIEAGQTVGMVLIDVTDPGMRREQIAEKARQVIRKNLETVQSIAAELGENMAETEILLRSLAEDYAAAGGGTAQTATGGSAAGESSAAPGDRG